MISGYENHHGQHAGGHITMSTRNNRLDLQDWLALAGVDPERVYDEAIEVVAPSSRGPLAEHLLLVGGHFQHDTIFRAAVGNGAGTTIWNGESVLLVKAYPREADEMTDERWLMILDNQVSLLGTPTMVREAFERRKYGTPIDPILGKRLKRMANDVSSWNVLESSITRAGGLLQINPVWIRLLEKTDVLMVAVHFGSHIRIDFIALNETGAEAKVRPEDFAEVFRASDPAGDLDAVWHDAPRPDHVVTRPDLVAGSLTLSNEKFDRWGARVSTRHRIKTDPPPVTTGSD